jgi:hypothetical protein
MHPCLNGYVLLNSVLCVVPHLTSHLTAELSAAVH